MIALGKPGSSLLNSTCLLHSQKAAKELYKSPADVKDHLRIWSIKAHITFRSVVIYTANKTYIVTSDSFTVACFLNTHQSEYTEYSHPKLSSENYETKLKKPKFSIQEL